MSEVYLTNEVAKILDVSIATVRNYAKSLERAGYQFQTKKQARLWTETEINIVKRVQQFYANNDYALEQAFDYVVKVHNEGVEAGNELLQTFTPTTTYKATNTPDNEYLAGIQDDTKAIINMLSDLQGSVLKKDTLLELQSDNEELANLKNENADLNKSNEELLKELEAVKEEKAQIEKQIEKLKEMNTLEFWKFKKE